MSAASRRILDGIWLACFFVCPLIFFTDLTRNPYITQIVLLNVAAAAAATICAWSSGWRGEWILPRTPLDAPLALWIGACLLSWLWAYTHHNDFFLGAIRTQGVGATAFLTAGMLAPFYFGVLCARTSSLEREPALKPGWPIFFVVWGALWTLHSAVVPAASVLTLDGHFWDSYGGLLWIAGFGVLLAMTKGATLHDYWRVLLGVAFLSGVYGICQYLGVEMIWPRMLNPYGGRSVSTFGNPNFLSSFMVVLLPVALLYYLKAKRWPERLAYAAVLFAMEGSLLSSLTRSSWIGALVSVGVLMAWKPVRVLVAERSRVHAAMLGIAAVLVLAWPHTSVQGSTPTVLGRVAELERVFETKPVEVYSPFYQRVLIWACAWQMGKENPLLGKGWGLFEMFYPFYQGNLLAHYDFLRNMRTHGNGAHNEILEAWSQTGILGVGAIVWIWIVFFYCFWRWLKTKSANEWALAAAAGVAGMLVDNLLNVSLHFAVPAFVFWWQAGAAMGIVKPEGKGWRGFRLPGRAFSIVLATIAIAVGCVFSGWWYRQWNREQHYYLGFKLFHSGRFTSAIDELETAYQWDSHEVNTDYELGNAYARVERNDRAVWAYGQALQANSGYDEIYYNAGNLLLQKLGKPEEGIRYLRVALWINPLLLKSYALLSSYYMNHLDQYQDDALELLERAAHFFPDNGPILANLGNLYDFRHDDARAEDLHAKALRIDPDLPIADRFRAELARQGRKGDPLLSDLQAYQELVARIGRKDYSDATLEMARRSAVAFPMALKPRLIAGNLEAIHGHTEEALKWLEPLSSQDSEDANLWQNLGELYLRMGRRDDAIRAFQTTLRLVPGNDAARRRLVEIGAAGSF